jgi:hypothetical protein
MSWYRIAGYVMVIVMKFGISHDREAEETLEAKARWFLQKPQAERLREALEDIVLLEQMRRFEPPDDRSSFTTVRVLERPSG